MKSFELFAGCGGLALGFEKAGFNCIGLNEWDKHASATLSLNRPEWNVKTGDINTQDFSSYEGQVDVLTGGFPCQAFSYAGNKLGFADTRGTLVHAFIKVAKQIKPKMVVAENVKGLGSHDRGRTFITILDLFEKAGYRVVSSEVHKAVDHMVPQKRERFLLWP